MKRCLKTRDSCQKTCGFDLRRMFMVSKTLFLLFHSYSTTSCGIDLKDLLTSQLRLQEDLNTHCCAFEFAKEEPLTTPPAMPTKQKLLHKALFFNQATLIPGQWGNAMQGGCSATRQVIINNNSNSKPFSGHSSMSNNLFCLKECLDFFTFSYTKNAKRYCFWAECRKWCPLSVEHKHYPWAWECRLWGWLQTKSSENVQKSKSLLDFSIFSQ